MFYLGTIEKSFSEFRRTTHLYQWYFCAAGRTRRVHSKLKQLAKTNLLSNFSPAHFRRLPATISPNERCLSVMFLIFQNCSVSVNRAEQLFPVRKHKSNQMWGPSDSVRQTCWFNCFWRWQINSLCQLHAHPKSHRDDSAPWRF